MNKVSTKIAQLSFEEEESILNVEIFDGADMSADNLKEHYQAIKKVTNGKKYFALIDVKNLYMIGLDGLDYAASSEALENRLAAAYCNPPLSNRLNITFLKVIRKLPIPMDIFATKESGLDWLRELRNKEEGKV